MKKRIAIAAACLAAGVAAYLAWNWRVRPGRAADEAFQAALAGVVDDHRKIIVLMDGVDDLDATTRARCIAAGRALF
jgi:hypothetical protein